MAGTNYNAVFNPNVKSVFNDDDGLMWRGECVGNPNAVATESGVYLIGCEILRKDFVMGGNLYIMDGTIDSPTWSQIGSGGGSIGGSIEAGEVAFGSGTNTITGTTPNFTYSESQNILNVLGVSSTPEIHFSGSGLDDLSASGSYSGSGNGVGIFLIANAGNTELQISGRSGTDNFNGTITSSSGGSATLVFDGQNGNAPTQIYIRGITGTFLNGDTITDGTTTATISSQMVLTADEIAFFDGNNGMPVGPITFTPITGSPQVFTAGFTGTFGSTTGHTVQNQWVITSKDSGKIVTEIFNGNQYQFTDGASHTFTIQAPSLSGDLVMNLPTDLGTNGQVLTTNGTGDTSWTSGGGGGSPGGSNTDVQFNDGGTAFGGENNFTYDKTWKNFIVRGNANSFLSVNDSGMPNIYAVTSGGSFIAGDKSGLGNHMKEVINDSAGLTEFGGYKGDPSATMVTFTGTPPNNFQLNSVLLYSGTSPSNFSITVVGNDDSTQLVVGNMSITGTFNIGDTIDNGAGATATVTYVSVGGSTQLSINAITGTFTAGDMVTVTAGTNVGSNGVLDQADPLCDSVDITDGITTYNGMSVITLGSSVPLQGVVMSFTATSGNTIGNNWTFTVFPPEYGNFLRMIQQDGQVLLGDADNKNGGAMLKLTGDANKFAFIYSNNFQIYNRANNNRVFYASTDPSTITVGMGDTDNAGHSSRFDVDDVNSIITAQAQIAFTYQTPAGKKWIDVRPGGATAKFGDIDAQGNSTLITVNDGSQSITVHTLNEFLIEAVSTDIYDPSGTIHLALFTSNGPGSNIYVGIGDIDGSANNTALFVDDSTGFITSRGTQVSSTRSIANDTDVTIGAVKGFTYYQMNPVTVDVTATLPASPVEGETYVIKNKVFGTFDVTVDGNGNNIDGSPFDTIPGSATVQESKTYVFVQAEWSIY